MHEYALTEEIVRIVLDASREHGLQRVVEVRLDAGACSGVSIEAVRQAWEILSGLNEELTGCSLEISRIKAQGSCMHCGFAGAPADERLRMCPRCGMGGFRLESGDEFRVTGISGE